MMTNTETTSAAEQNRVEANASTAIEGASKIDERTDALVAELRAMREKVAEVMGKSHAPADAKVRAA